MKSGMTTRLWNYVSTFSNLSGPKLQQIYSKLKQEKEAAAGVGTSLMKARGFRNDSSNQSSALLNKGLDTAKFEAWKRRRRAESDPNPHLQPPQQRPFSNGARLPDLSLGILGAPPSDMHRPFSEERPQRTRQSAFGPKQGFT